MLEVTIMILLTNYPLFLFLQKKIILAVVCVVLLAIIVGVVVGTLPGT